MRNEPTREDAERLIAEASAEAVDHIELVRRLLLLNRISDWYYQRCVSEGSGRVEDVEIHPGGLTLKIRNEQNLEYFQQANGYRWRLGSALISRMEAERFLGVWPGYLDAIEGLFRYIFKSMFDLEHELKRAHEEITERAQKIYFQMSEELHQRSANERHPELRRWRDRSPATASIAPEKLKGIRNLKRLEISDPCHIYFLLHKGEVVYVGQTGAAWPGRIIQHLRGKQKTFDDVWYLEVDRPSLSIVERRFIDEFKPRYNGMRSSLEDKEEDD